jgi:predicted AAA+ superfamily ATPase
MITREHYIEEIREFYDSDLIKIITGIRRSGKSIILQQIMDEVRAKSKNVIYLNFEDSRTLEAIPDADSLLDYVEKHRGKGLNYLFFDEIHEVEGWQFACKTLRLDGTSVFITGSNSKLLAREYTKEFSGRYIALRVRPFVYKEVMEYANELGREVSVADYLVWGGFPKRLEFESQAAQEKYLLDLNHSIVENDLIVRYDIQNTALFRRVVSFVLRSNARVFSARSIEAYLKNEHVGGSVNTIIKYLGYLEEAYIIERISPYSKRTKAELTYSFKLYDADVSLNSIRVTDGRYDLTHNLENVIYNELVYMGYKMRVLNNEGGEIDFVAEMNSKKYYIQVAYSVAEEKAYEREMGAFENVDNDGQKVLITADELDYSTSTVRHIKLKDFLLMETLD